ncbi:hypothetical protein OESDEN_18742, partial [Oesophagostomum dentatum]
KTKAAFAARRREATTTGSSQPDPELSAQLREIIEAEQMAKQHKDYEDLDIDLDEEEKAEKASETVTSVYKQNTVNRLNFKCITFRI